MDRPKKILIIKLSSLGDVIHTLPAATSIKNGFKEAKVFWLINSKYKELIENSKTIDEIIEVDGKIESFFRAISKIRREKFDLLIDFQGLFKTGIISFLSGARRKIGFDKTKELAHIFLDEKPISQKENIHAIKRYLKICEYLGVKPIYQFPIEIGEKERKKIDELLSDIGPFLIINPFARWESKVWEIERYIELSEMIKEKLKITPIFTGAKDEEPLFFEMKKYLKDPFFLFGLSLKELCCLFLKSICVICPDTGSMHLAAALKVPTISLFGPTSPKKTGPFGEGHIILKKDIDCSPCFKKVCNDKRCLKMITVDEVFLVTKEVVEKRLKEKK